MKKRMITLVLVAALATALTACSAKTSSDPTPTAEPANEADATATPKAESTAAPTAEPTVEPTAAPTATSIPTPEATEAPAPTAEPVVEPTETPAPTAEPVVEPTEAPAPTVEPTAEISEFAAMLKELHSLQTYEERVAYVEKLDKSKYKVGEEEGFDLVTHCNGKHLDIIETYDMETGEYITEVAPDSRIHYPSFPSAILRWCIGLDDYYYYENTVGAYAGEDITGENYLLTVTDIATGETDPWGVKINYAGMIVESIEENEWGYSYAKVAVDPNSPVKTAYCTWERLLNERNDSWGAVADYYYDMRVTMVEPIRPEERYDENWNPTGEYIFYETSEETVYVAKEDLEYDEWGECYYCYDEYGWYQEVLQDETGAYYYIWERQYEVPVEERGYTVAVNENFGSYLLDKDGAPVTGTNEYTREYTDPSINTWDTLKYYQDVYDPRFRADFAQVIMYQGEYAITDMKAEDYPYLSAEEFDSLMKHYMEIYGITLDEEVLAIRASIPKEWGWQYEDYYDKECVLGIGGEWTDSGDFTYEAVITIERPEHWYFSYSSLAVKDESISTNEPAHTVEYIVAYAEPGETEEETKEAALNYLTQYDRYLTKEEAEHVKTLTVKGKPVFYAETTDSWDEGWKRSFIVMQDIGFSRLISMEIESYDLETEAEKLISQFLLDDNYTVEQ